MTKQEAKELKERTLKTINGIIESGNKSYTIGGQSLTRLDLPELRKIVADCDIILNNTMNNRRFNRIIPMSW